MTKNVSHLHPELHQVAKKFPTITYNKKNLPLLRWVMRLRPPLKMPRDVLVENISIPRPATQTRIRLRIYKSKTRAAPTPGLLWMHGGGYVLGNPEQDDYRCAQYVHALGITVVSVAYRYAPKYPFPAGLDDCYAALKWVAMHSAQMSIDEKRIAIGGASAGGGLAAALAQFTHDRQELKILFQLLVYPMLDDRTVLRADLEAKKHIAWNQKSNRFGWESYLASECGAETVPPYAVPARRADLSGLPAAWIGVGTEDLFYDEAAAYASGLRACGVACELYRVQGAFHGFDVFDPKLTIVQDFQNAQIAALKKFLFA